MDLNNLSKLILQMLASRSRVVAYLPSLRAAVRHFRAFSSYDERKPANSPILVGAAVGKIYEIWLRFVHMNLRLISCYCNGITGL